MTIENMLNGKTVTLELVGLGGNAFSILGAFRKQAQREKWTSEEISSVMAQAMAGDYDHLLATIMNYTKEPEVEGDDEFEEEIDVEVDPYDPDWVPPSLYA